MIEHNVINENEVIKAKLVRERNWERTEAKEFQTILLSVIVPKSYTTEQVCDAIKLNPNFWTWEVVSLDRPSTKGGYDDEF